MKHFGQFYFEFLARPPSGQLRCPYALKYMYVLCRVNG